MIGSYSGAFINFIQSPFQDILSIGDQSFVAMNFHKLIL